MRKYFVEDRSELLVADTTGGDVLKVTATHKNNPRDGAMATEMLQAVLKSSKCPAPAVDGAAKVHPLTDAFSSLDAGAPAASISLGERVGWKSRLETATFEQDAEELYTVSPKDCRHFSPRENWIRLERKAAKVGRGLSKDEKGLKLGPHHWLEAIDPKHRYGHNLRFFYEVWIKSQTTEPFYYWLDHGEGKELDLEVCSREKLEVQCIKYLAPKERKAYEVIIEDGKLVYKLTRELVHTPRGDRWIFVLSPCGKLYVAKKEKGKFQHSSFLAGGVTTAAGRLVVNHGVLQLMEAHSGHYLPTPENFRTLISSLTNSGADLTVAKVHLESEDEIAKRALAKSGSVSSMDNETTFIALLASAGFTILSDSNARFTKCDSDSGREDLFDSAAAALPETLVKTALELDSASPLQHLQFYVTKLDYTMGPGMALPGDWRVYTPPRHICHVWCRALALGFADFAHTGC